MRLLLTAILAAFIAISTSAQVPQTFSASEEYTPRVFPVEGDKKKSIRKADKKTTEARPFAAARITIPVSVFDQNGEFVRSIPSDSFKLLVDGQEVPITSVTTDPQPVSIVLLIDMSPSGEDQKKERFAYANSLIDSLGPEDKAIVFSLTTKLKQRSELTGDKEALKKAVSKLGMGDGTAIYDALREFYSTHLPTVPGRKAVVLLTDGVDTTSRESTFSDSLEFAERFEVPAFPIFFDTYPDMIKRQKALPPILQ